MTGTESELKKQVWVLSNENNQLKELNSQLDLRLNEYIKWSEQAQRELEGSRLKIEQLETSNKDLHEKATQGTVSMSQNLLGENAELGKKIKDLETDLLLLNELINPLVLNTMPVINSSLKNQLISNFKKADPQKKIIALFLRSPERILTSDDVSREGGLDISRASLALRTLDNQNLIREIKKGQYQVIQAVGDKVISLNDLQRVSNEALTEFFSSEILKGNSNADYDITLDMYHTELQRRHLSDMASNILSLKGKLHMSKRSADWIIEQLETYTNIPEVVENTSSKPFLSSNKSISSNMANQTQQTSSSPNNQYYDKFSKGSTNTESQSSGLTKNFDIKEWDGLTPSEILANCRAKIKLLRTSNDAIQLLTFLRDNLSATVSGTLLYQISSNINELKKSETLNKESLDSLLFEWYEKVR